MIHREGQLLELLERKERELQSQREQLREQDIALQTKDQTIEQLTQERDEYKLAYDKLIHQRFRNRSERYIDNPDQLRLDFGDTDEAADAALGLANAVEDLELTIPEHRRRKARKKRDEGLPEHLPRYEVTADAPDEVKSCATHGERTLLPESMWDRIETLEFERPKGEVRVTKYPKYACANHPECGVRSPERPVGLVEGNKYDTSIAAEIITGKYGSYPDERKQWLRWYQQLYDIESRGRPMPAEERLELRKCEAKPIWEVIKEWLETVKERTTNVILPKSDLAKALQYVRNHFVELTRYLEDGGLPIDNNEAEQLMRQIALARKNWLFAGSVAGGERSAGFLTLVSSALRNDLDVWVYIKDVLDHVLAGATDYEALLPWNWAASHPSAIRTYRVKERRDRDTRKPRTIDECRSRVAKQRFHVPRVTRELFATATAN